jgi:hypothetical protein
MWEKNPIKIQAKNDCKNGKRIRMLTTTEREERLRERNLFYNLAHFNSCDSLYLLISFSYPFKNLQF